VVLVEGQAFRFDLSDEPGDAGRVNLPHPEIIQTLQKGDTLLLDDGKLRMTVTDKGDGFVETVVEVGGALSNRKGVNTPSVVLPISPLTPKDRADLEFALSIGVDWVALSFVQRPQDIAELRSLVGNKAKIMAKLEKPSAVEEGVVDDIIMLSDGIMVARGDLGVEMRPEDVPVIQKQIIEKCRRYGRPVVVATQMLESMIESPTPTRAEASDVATAIYDGADAIMLSAESAAGKYPVEAVTMQQRVILRVEEDKAYRKNLARSNPAREKSATDAITNAAREIAATVGAAAVVVFTARGTTVLRASMGRPPVPILAITPEIETARSLALTWGVYPAAVSTDADKESFPDVLSKICLVAKDKGLVSRPDDLLVVTAGLPFGSPGVANVIRVVPASGPEDWVVGGSKELNTI
jgi:pyruvate kinase